MVSYRYGFNGMEKDDEVKGSGSSYTTLYRQYDARVGRWLSVDPEAKSFPDKTPFIAYSNNPLIFVDPLGDADFYSVKGSWIGTDGVNDGKAFVLTSSKLKRDVEKATKHGMFYSQKVENSTTSILIPTGNMQKEVSKSIQSTLSSGVENGGHAFASDKSALHWDPGRTPTSQKLKDGRTMVSAGIDAMKIGGSQGQQFKRFANEELLFYWHVHPNVKLSGVQLGSSTPTVTADYDQQKQFEGFGYKGTAFVIGAYSNTVTCYDSQYDLFTMDTPVFLSLGNNNRNGVDGGQNYNDFMQTRISNANASGNTGASLLAENYSENGSQIELK